MAIGMGSKARGQVLLSIIFLLLGFFLFQLGQPLMPFEQNSSNDNFSDLTSAESIEEDNHELEGSFPTLDSMLQWAIGHSDPAKLKETVQDFKEFSPEELLNRQLELKELMGALTLPSDAELMKMLIADLNNSSASQQDKQQTLNDILILVENIDDLIDMDKMGGSVLVPVIKELENTETEIRTTCALILAKASQHDAHVQNQIVGYGALTRLMEMVNSSYTEEAIKALYTISSLLQHNENGQEIFYSQGGSILLQDLLMNSSTDIRLLKKAVVLLGDLVEFQTIKKSSEINEKKFVLRFLSNKSSFLKSLITLLTKSDLDLQEKVLMAIKSLLQLETREALNFEELSSLDRGLEKMRVQLEMLTSDEDQRDYALDVEIIRKEVQTVFDQKIELMRKTSS